WQPELPLIEEERPVRSLQHKHQAQSYLMTGREKDARSELCKAVKIDPGGPAAELLAGLYLSQRSLSNAEAVLRPVLVSDPESKSGLELLGDILNQKGDLSGAKRLWLQVLKVDADETGVLLDISRRWVT